MKIVYYVSLAVIATLHLNRLFAAIPSAESLRAGAAFASIRMCLAKDSGKPVERLYIDVHHLGAGNVTADAVAKAHAKDLAVEGKYGVHFIQYWVDEAGGNVYCLSSTADSNAIRQTHAEAHGLLPDQIFLVTDGTPAPQNAQKNFYLDIHEFTVPVSPRDVAAAHQKDLAVENKRGVNFINYWVSGTVVVCLSQAPDSTAVIETHREAHGLLPSKVIKVIPGGN